MVSVDTLVEGLRWLLFEPITSLDPLVIGIQYLFFVLLAISASYLAKQFYAAIYTPEMMKPKKGDFSLIQVLLAGPLEEMGFRGTFYLVGHMMLGFAAVPVLFVANAVWAGYHLRSFSTYAFTFVLGLFLTKFWINGFGGLAWVAIVMHSLHNLVAYSLSQLVEQDPDPRMEEKTVTELDPATQ